MSSDWLADEFGDDPDIKSGRIESSKGLSPIETMALTHLLQIETNYQKFCNGFMIDVYPIASKSFVSKTLISTRRKRVAIIISLGFIRLIAALSIRASLKMTGTRKPFGISLSEMLAFDNVRTPEDRSLHEFNLTPAKRVAADLTEESIGKLLAKLRGAGTLAAIEYAAAALEFIALHEIAHSILRHREVAGVAEFWNALEPALQRLGPEFADYGYMPRTRFDRALEHTADFAAMFMMWIRAPIRITSPKREIRHLHCNAMSRRSLGVAGAGVAFAAIALVAASEPNLELQLSIEASQGHPSPISRLPTAVTLLISAFEQHPVRRVLFGLPLKGYANVLNVMQYAVNFHSMSALRAQWEETQPSPEALPAWLFKLFDTSRCSDYATSETLRDVMMVQSLSKMAKDSWHFEPNID